MSQSGLSAEPGSAYRTPRWVKWTAIIVVVVAVLVGILLLSGEHGPGRHLPGGGASTTPAISVTQGHTFPIEHGAGQP